MTRQWDRLPVYLMGTLAMILAMDAALLVFLAMVLVTSVGGDPPPDPAR